MIFLTAFTQNIIVEEYKKKRQPGQFYEEYKYLLKSIYKHYPEAKPVLFIYEGKINDNELRKINPNIEIFNWHKRFEPEIGIDLNGLKILKATVDLFDDDIFMLDSDCLVVKRFDEYLKDDIDITLVTRGPIKWLGQRNDIIFAPAIYHRYNKNKINIYIDELFKRGIKKAIQMNDYWANVQPCVCDILYENNIDTTVDYEGFPSKYGEIKINDADIKIEIVPQYILGYPIQNEKYYPETAVIHYKNYRLRKIPGMVHEIWCK